MDNSNKDFYPIGRAEGLPQYGESPDSWVYRLIMGNAERKAHLSFDAVAK